MKRTLIATLLAAFGIALSGGAANAQVVNVQVGGPPVVVGWHGDRYWDGHRYWQRREWMEHHRHDRPHCPPGHWGHNECR
ncbi:MULTISPECIES: hypothetical protein [Burkholderia]|jgi:hypothetical protein|uniref:Uncharacterized protein n=2 Tax=Burkholderia gladioli TaxID=28095 RepID=A0A104JD88_BURGA|nr:MULTISPECIES: hypothetical protein [Burkholderia]AEA64574.1 hypothetical protein bgla_2g21400 [Burkholderia gladioli BSR3]ATF88316.1 hypothetical protein CO712_25115 [Burkholderia gladioli pv. gladioli]AYQ91077.1 hypothetical protein EDD84_27430 [Burkholderia gladioli]KGE07984.1 membrane protein [Burkholderia gladioli]KVM61058.1 hypothetical protein WJ59_28335 [Burkholderia gladioli]